MGIINNIKNIKTISSTSNQGIISISNENFKKISESLYKFLTNISYDEIHNSLDLSNIHANVIRVNNKVEMIINSSKMFEVNNNGRLYARNSIITDGLVEAKKFRAKLFDGFPTQGNAGEIVYGRQQSGQYYDFWGYIQDVGWMSLTGIGSIGSPILPGANIVWNGSVLSVETSPPTPTRYARYLIDWQNTLSGDFVGHSGEIATYNFENTSWDFLIPDDGSYVVVESDGNKTYVSENDGSTINWAKELSSSVIGPDEDEDPTPYENGRHIDFTEDTTIGTAVDRFNIDLKNIYDKCLLSLKYVLGNSHTNNSKNHYDEIIPSYINTHTNKIFVDNIDENPIDAIDNGIVCEIYADLIPISGSDGHAFKAVYPNPLPVDVPDGVVVGDIVLNSVSPTYGTGYKSVLYSSGNIVIPNNDSRGWIYQYSSGILFQETVKTPIPNKIKLYVYKGNLLSDVVSSSIKLSYNNKYMSVPYDINGDNINTTLFISDEPKKGSNINVFINGININVGNGIKTRDCYFSSDGGATAKNFSNLQIGDLLYYNKTISGYKLDNVDKINFDYLCESSESITQGSGSYINYGNYLVADGVSLDGGDYINIYLDGGVAKIRKADFSLSLPTHGYVISNFLENELATVFYSGINPFINYMGSPDISPGTNVYLSTDGKIDINPPTDINDTIIQYIGYVINETSIFVSIDEYSFIEN